MQYVSPQLLASRNLVLAVPGTYFSYDWIEEDDVIDVQLMSSDGLMQHARNRSRSDDHQDIMMYSPLVSIQSDAGAM